MDSAFPPPNAQHRACPGHQQAQGQLHPSLLWPSSRWDTELQEKTQGVRYPSWPQCQRPIPDSWLRPETPASSLPARCHLSALMPTAPCTRTSPSPASGPHQPPPVPSLSGSQSESSAGRGAVRSFRGSPEVESWEEKPAIQREMRRWQWMDQKTWEDDLRISVVP